MKKHTQRQLLGLLKSIVKGVTYIKENPQTNQTQTVYNDCNAAINMIRKTFESELSDQSYSSYTELFDKVMNGLEGSAGIQDEAARKQLLDEAISALHDLDRTLQSETEINKEIVFFPYKSSMWDSMESIWRAAKEDPRCDVYVVPIPYYTNGKMEYEGHLFPKDVPVIHYSVYKMEVQLPDIAYIHNPYDNYNRVTSVAPEYFSSELKKYTKKLVYSPYFVTDGSTVQEHFCKVPALRNCDLVVVQSEAVREEYVKFLPKEKVVALGSPKFDKVIYNQENGVEIPKEWESKIGDKKVVLYNTSLASLLSNRENYLKKVHDVIESFKGSQEMVLLWRPHPLMRSTIQSMTPHLLPFYDNLVQNFVQEGVGILDTSGDPHVAIAISDIYYGDLSSMYPLVAATGKPIAFMDVSLLDQGEKKKPHLNFEAIAVKDEQKMYAFASEYNALFEVDLPSGEAKLLGNVPDQPFLAKCSYMNMEIVGDKIVLIPFLDKNVNGAPQFAEYSISENTFQLKELQDLETLENSTHKKDQARILFNAAYRFGNSVFFTPNQYGAIVEYEVESGKISYHTEPLEHLNNKDKQSRYFTSFGCQVGAELYLPLEDSNQVLKFSMENGDFKYLSIGTKDSRYSSCYASDEMLWCVSSEDGSVTQYNLNKMRFEKNFKLPNDVQKSGHLGQFFGTVICSDSELLLTPRLSNEVVCFDTSSRKIEIDKTLPVSPFRGIVKYSKAAYFDEKAYLYNYQLGEVVKYDLSTKSVDTIELTLSSDEADRVLNFIVKENSIQEASGYVPGDLNDSNFRESLKMNGTAPKYLKTLLDIQGKVTSQVRFLQGVNKNLDGTCGEEIHKYTMSEID